MPKATVLIPLYNCGKFVKKAIDSICTQNFSDFDILIIDDGSSDNSEEVINKLKVRNLKYLKNDKNIGIVETLNRGIDLIESPYIVRMDADDIMLQNRLKRQTAFLDTNCEYGMVGSWYHVINESGNRIGSRQLNTEHDYLKLMLIFSNTFAHSSVTMRTDLARKLRYDKGFQYCEDHELWIRFSKIARVANLPEFHLLYRKHGTSTCSQNQKELKTLVLNLLSRELDELGINHSERELMLHGSACFGMSRIFYANPETKRAIDNWYNRIFESPILNARYSKPWLDNFKKQIYSTFLS